MKYKPHAAFGWVVVCACAKAGETNLVALGENGKYSGYYYFTKGRSEAFSSDDGGQYPDRVPGWFNREKGQMETRKITVVQYLPEDTEWVCIQAHLNGGKLPENLEHFEMQTDKKKVIKDGANLFLARGKVVAGEKEFTGPAQIRIRTPNTTLVATEDCYFLEFK